MTVFLVQRPAKFRDETHFVLYECLKRLDLDECFSTPDILAPHVPVTELVHAREILQQRFLSSNSSSTVGEAFEEGLDDAAFVAGVLWLHLKRLPEPLFTFDLFGEMIELVLRTAPCENEQQAQTEAYIERFSSDIALPDLSDLVLRIPVNERANLCLIFEFISALIHSSNTLTTLGVSNVLSPILARPRGTAPMSIRHRMGLIYVRLVICALLENFECLKAAFLSTTVPKKRSNRSASDFVHSLSNLSSPSGKPRRRREKRKSKACTPVEPSKLEQKFPSKSPRESHHASAGSAARSSCLSPEASSRHKLSVRTSGESDAIKNPFLEAVNLLISAGVQNACRGNTAWMSFARKCVLQCEQPDADTSLSKKPPRALLAKGAEGKKSRAEPCGSERVCAVSETSRMEMDTQMLSKSHSDGRLLKRTQGELEESKSGSKCVQDRLDQALSNLDRTAPRNQEESDMETKRQEETKREEVKQHRPAVVEDTLLSALESKKKSLKKKLKHFDEEFERKHGRRPGRLEKEPIRSLYEEYNSIKRRILHHKEAQELGKKESLRAHPTISTHQESSPPPVDILLKEKRALQTKLREFERNFEVQHSRKIKYAADIQGLEADYRRYKELKGMLATMNVFSPSSSPRHARYV